MKEKVSIIESAMLNHKIVFLIVGMLVIIGGFGLYKMPKQEFPSFTIREGVVIAVYPGATSLQIEEEVTKPLEKYIFEYEEVNRRNTYSMSMDGLVVIFVDLNDNVYDKDDFWSKFKHGLDNFKAQLPPGVLELMANDDIGDTSSLLITLESKDKTYRELQDYLTALEDMLRPIDAISKMRTYGLQKEQISIYLDQDKMVEYGIDSYTILTKLFVQGFTTLSGSIDNKKIVAPVHIANSYNLEKDIAEQIIYSDLQGNILRLKNVARIAREYPDPDQYITNNGKKCVLLSIEMRSGNDIVALGKTINKILDNFEKDLPDGVSIYKITDQSAVVNGSVNNFLRELLIAVISVIIVVILLMPIRVAGVSALSIPLTIFSALAIFFISGIELNTVTLAALIVTLGMVVDDSIVIIDNYMEKLDEGMPRWKAAVASPREFFQSVLSATLSISITFFPFLFTLHGMFGDFIKSFPWAITTILGISLIYSLLLIPFIQYTFIRKGIKQTEEEKKKKRKTMLDHIQDGYNWLLSKCFAHPAITLLTGVAAVIIGAVIFFNLPQRLMPIAQRNQFAVEFYLPQGAAIEQTAIVADSMMDILLQDSRIENITCFFGQGSPRFHTTYQPQIGGTNFAQFIVNTESEDATEDILDEYADKYADYFTNAYVRFKQMDYSDALYPIEYRLSGNNIADLKIAADSIMKYMHEIPELKLVRTNFGEQLAGMLVNLNEDEANRLGVNKSLLSVDLAVQLNKNGVPITTMWEADYPVGIALKSERADNLNLSDLPYQYVQTLNGLVAAPLRQVAEVGPDWNEGTIVHRNGIRTLSVIAEVTRGNNIGNINKQVLDKIKHIELPQGTALTIGGMYERDNDTLPGIINGLLIAIGVIFFILLFHFGKIKLALVTLVSIALCIFGASIGLLITGFDLGLTAILGIVSLMGILVRNGIIMFDFAEEIRVKENLNVHDAAMHAGQRRMRPIFLTSAAASVGVLPMILERSTLWAPMGTVIFFGTLISMVLISTMLPVAYWQVFKNEKTPQETDDQK